MFFWKIKSRTMYIDIISDSEAILQLVKACFDAHNEPDVPTALLPSKRTIRIQEKAEGQYFVYKEGCVRECTSCEAVLGVVVDWLYNSLPTEEYFYLHGGAVSKNKTCIALLAPSNMGKTTIVVDFLKRGYGYYSDDIIPIHKKNLTVCSFPKPLFLREDSPHIGNTQMRIKNGTYERQLFIPKAIEHLPQPLTCIFLLNRDQQFLHHPHIETLAGAEKIRSVLYNIYTVSNAQEAAICTMRLLRQTKVYRLNYFSSSEAIDCIEAWSFYEK